jgi:hypothetical protein
MFYQFLQVNKINYVDTICNENGNITMILNNNNEKINFLFKKENIKNLYGAHQNIWSKNGISRLFNGYRKKIENNDFIEKKYSVLFKDEQYIPFNNNEVRPNLIKNPNNLIFLVDDFSNTLPNLSKINDFTFIKSLFISGLTKINNLEDLTFQPLYQSNHFHFHNNPIEIGIF